MAFWGRPQAEATSGETLTKKQPSATEHYDLPFQLTWSFHRTIVKTITSNVFNCDLMKHRWPKREIWPSKYKDLYGEMFWFVFPKTRVTHTARKLKNSILGSKLYWFPKKKKHWNTPRGYSWDILQFHYSIRACHARCFFCTQDYSLQQGLLWGHLSIT